MLLHSFKKNCAAVLVHFVELVYAAYPQIAEDQSSAFQDELSCLGVFADVGCQTHRAGSSSAGVYASWSYFVDLLKKLRFGCGRVAYETDVDVRSKSASSHLPEFLLGASKKLCQNTLFDFIMAVDGRGKAGDQVVDDGVPLGHRLELIFLDIVKLHFSFFSFEPIFIKNFVRNSINIGIEN